MQNYGFGALQHPQSMAQEVDNHPEDLAWMQYPGNDQVQKVDGLGLQFTDDLSLEPSTQWPYMTESPSLIDPQLMSHLPLDNNSQFIIPEQQQLNLAQQGMQVPFDFNMHAAPSIASTATPPHLGAVDYLSPWSTPELEPTTLDEINAWISLDHSQRRSPGSISSSMTSSSIATPSVHSRASSLESVPRFKPTSVQKEKPQCWEHGCNGRTFSTYGNYVRHCKERSDKRPQRKCPKCGALFSRTTARNQHLAKNACNRIRRYSNGRQRPDFTTAMKPE